MADAILARIQIHPIKALDPVSVAEARIGPGGGLVGDRRLAMLDDEGQLVNGKRTAAVHRVRAAYDLAAGAVLLEGARFSLDGDLAALEERLSLALGLRVHLARDDRTGFPDDLEAPGPTLVGRASLEAVCGWFPALTLESARRRFRANLEIAGPPAFWEDRLFGRMGETVRFRIGEVAVEGTNPCQRCAVPSRDPDTGEALPGFQRRFAERRRAELPPWAEASRFDHFYRFTVNTRVAAGEAGKTLRLGDRLTMG